MMIYILLRSAISYLLVGLLCVLFIPPLFIIACLPKKFRYDNRVFFYLLDWFYKLSCLAPLCPITVIGRDNLPDGPAIFVPNHQSSLDIPLVGSLLNGYPHVWLVLEYYVNAPVLGFFIRRMFVPVDRESPRKAARSLIQVYRFVQQSNRHLIIFPEGGRFTDGKVHPFYEGFAVLARKTGRPVIPIYMPYNGEVYHPHGYLLKPGPIVVVIGEQFFMQEYESDKDFSDRVRQWFLDEAEKF